MTNIHYAKALQDFKDARRQAALQEIIAQITGKEEEIQLLPFDEVREKLHGLEKSRQYLDNIPLDDIVGSVSRYHDFTRTFLPRESTDAYRWARVMAQTLGLTGLPPIEVYKLGEVYFVQDGNHRVSVARQLGNKTIQAFVTEVKTKVPITRDTKPDEFIIKAEYTNFLERTKLDQLRPQANLTVTKPGAYPTLLEHIEIHRYYMGIDEGRAIPYAEAVSHWYDHVYQPVVQIIEEKGILRDFPNRTETDLYLWLAEHRAELEQELGWDVGTEAAASDLAFRRGSSLRHFMKRIRQKIWTTLTPDILEEGPPPGTWREERANKQAGDHLFRDILVAIDHSPRKEHVLEQTLVIADHEGSNLHGVHIHPPEEDVQNGHSTDLEEEFREVCLAHGVENCTLNMATGDIPEVICKHARFTDLLAIPLNHPPGKRALERLSSGLRTIIRRCPRPILTVPGPATSLQHILLAYDGSPKAKEALFIAAYAASCWNSALTVLTSRQGISHPGQIQKDAQRYLQRRGVKASYLLKDEEIVEVIKDQAEKEGIDFILIGGYGATSMVEVVLGSSVDQVLREIQLPILICR
jgi:nucleotide-binding universal stress UspA family protein